MRFSNDFFFQWVENLWKKESIEKHKCISYFFVNTRQAVDWIECFRGSEFDLFFHKK